MCTHAHMYDIDIRHGENKIYSSGLWRMREKKIGNRYLYIIMYRYIPEREN